MSPAVSGLMKKYCSLQNSKWFSESSAARVFDFSEMLSFGWRNSLRLTWIHSCTFSCSNTYSFNKLCLKNKQVSNKRGLFYTDSNIKLLDFTIFYYTNVSPTTGLAYSSIICKMFARY